MKIDILCLPDFDANKATFKGRCLAGKDINNYRVYGFIDSYTSESGSIRHLWLVQCLKCESYLSLIKSSVVAKERKASSGCTICHSGRKISGSERFNWTGGSFIPGKFLSTIKNRLVRATKTLEFSEEINIEYLEALALSQNMKCKYTGRDLQFGSYNTGIETTASLDRIDSSKGYVPGNVQFVHKVVNKAKMDLSEDDFIKLCIEVSENYKKEDDN